MGEACTQVDEDKFDSFAGDNASSFSNSSLSRQMSNPATDLPRWLMPRSSTTGSDFFGRSGMGSDSQVIRFNEDDNKLEITMDVHGYKPEELKVVIYIPRF